MRKQLLLLSLSVLALSSFAGEGDRPVKQTAVTNVKATKPTVFPASRHLPTSQRASRALTKFPLSSAGNVLSVLNADCNQIYVDDSINSVIFIHRNDETAACCNAAGSNVAQYRFDVSKDRGTTWNANIGPLNPLADNIAINGRFPQAVIYREPGSTTADSAYLVYSGTWHDGANGSWQGEYRGVGKLSGDTSTFTESNDIVNGGLVAVAGGLSQGQPGFFINVNTSSNTSFSSPNNSLTNGLLIQKGQWNPATRNVDWTLDAKNFPIEEVNTGTQTFSAIGSPVSAFDPTGQYGWIVVDADIKLDGEYFFNLVMFKSTDFGQTWTGPMELNVDTLPGMFESPELIDQATGQPFPTNKTHVGGVDLSVDYLGRPHIATVVGIARTDAATYSYFPNAGLAMYDITIDENLCGVWQANFLAQVFSVSAEYTSAVGGEGNYSDDNRVQSSRSADGKKIFMFWNDTDESIASQQSQDANVSPNLFGVGIDVDSAKTTAIANFTEGDPLFGGETPANQPGSLFGSLFPVVSQNAFNNATSYNVPVVLTEPDYSNPSRRWGNAPARFYYCQNIDFAKNGFTLSLDNVPPVITMNGADTLVLQRDSTFNDPGATAFDCNDGSVTVVNSSTVNTSTPGYYTVTYYAQDAAGNRDSIVRTVLVAAKPIAGFRYTKVTGTRFDFVDTSLYFPTSYVWSFGDGSGSTQRNPIKNYTQNGPKTVCLIAINQFGRDTTCKNIEVTIGINETELSNAISVFPTNTTGELNIDIAKQFNDKLTITALDVRGALVAAPVIIEANSASTRLNLSTLANGNYQLRIGNEKQGYTVKKFTITK